FLRGLLAAPQPSVRRPLAVLAVYWAALIPAFAVWLWRDRTYAPWDPAYHSYLVMRLHDGLVRGNVWRFYELDRFYPPLFHALAVPASFFSDHPDAFAFGNWLALLALLCATWATAAPLAGADAALAAAFLVPGYAYVAWMCRMAMTDLTQAARVASGSRSRSACSRSGRTRSSRGRRSLRPSSPGCARRARRSAGERCGRWRRSSCGRSSLRGRGTCDRFPTSRRGSAGTSGRRWPRPRAIRRRSRSRRSTTTPTRSRART